MDNTLPDRAFPQPAPAPFRPNLQLHRSVGRDSSAQRGAFALASTSPELWRGLNLMAELPQAADHLPRFVLERTFLGMVASSPLADDALSEVVAEILQLLGSVVPNSGTLHFSTLDGLREQLRVRAGLEAGCRIQL